MYEDLIERIKAQRRYAEANYDATEYNDVINDVLEIIRQADPPILDMPDSEGWWLNITDNEARYVYVLKLPDPHQSLYYWDAMNPEYYIIRLTGKWQKIPEPKEIDNADNKS